MDSCSCLFKIIPAIPIHTALLPRAMPIWADSTKRVLSSIVARPRAITSQVVPSDLPYRNPEHRELFLSGLRLAAGETT
jgi:hypothetical protein